MKKKIQAALFLLGVLLLVWGVRASGLGAKLDPIRLREWIDQYGSAGPLVYLFIFAVAPSLFLPGLPITVAGGLAFGPVRGTIYASIGSTLGAGLAFLISRYLARERVAELLGERWRRIDAGVARRGWIAVAGARLIPIFPFNLLNYAFGLTRIPFWTYLLASWLFMLPGTIAYVVFSSSLLDLLRGEFSPAFWIGLLLLLLVGSIPFVYRKWKGMNGGLFYFVSAMLVAPALISVPSRIGAQEPLRLLNDRGAADPLPEGWRPLTFPKIARRTDYRLIREGDRPVIRAESRRSASGVYLPLDLDPKIYSVLSWCWRIDHVVGKGDETTKAGDDYAARIYVTFKFDPARAGFWEKMKYKTIKLIYGGYPPKGAINYVWAGRAPVGESFPNPYADRARMIVVESGNEKAGGWVCEERNLDEDYRRSFGEAPPSLSGVAVMTDTDDTQEEASADYADLILRGR